MDEHRDALFPVPADDYPLFANVCDWTHDQGGIAGWARGAACIKQHQSLPVVAALGKLDLVESIRFNCFFGFLFWYRLLNCGLRLAITGGSDFPFGTDILAPWNLHAHTSPVYVYKDSALVVLRADVSNLVPLFEAPEFRNVRFLVFHGSWPNTGAMGYFAAVYEHVYLDFNCLVALSREIAGRALSEWLDVVPLHKLMTGTDGPYLEWWIATARATRHLLTEVLGNKIAQGLYSESMALDAAKAILDTNPREVLGLPRR